MNNPANKTTPGTLRSTGKLLLAFLATTLLNADAELLVLPLPDGETMEFVEVQVSTDQTLFPLHQFKIGDRASGVWQEYPTDVGLGGAFLLGQSKESRWVYYMGKTEVSEAAYHALMPGSPAPSDGKLPARNIPWIEVQQFINNYNLWLYKEAREKIPASGDRLGYLRLPTESEWEFAARGGLSVAPARFDEKHPYGPALSKHEWFSGPESSHNKIRQVGLLQPNELGLHDMLGNVAEMTMSLYAVEYYQGRTGGLVVRGGDSFTAKEDMRSSLRTEMPFYNRDYQPSRQETVGFRLVLVSQLFTGPEDVRAMKQEWPDYRQSRAVPTIPTLADRPTSARATGRITDIRKHLETLKGQTAADSSPAVTSTLGLLDAAIGDVESLVYRAERDSAAAWVKIASNSGYFLARELRKKPKSERLLELVRNSGTPAEITRDETRHANLLMNIEDAANQYADALKELSKLDRDIVLEAFATFQEKVTALKLNEQIKANDIIVKHVKDYFDTKRLDMEAYQRELQSL
jgi:hypothetical protein